MSVEVDFSQLTKWVEDVQGLPQQKAMEWYTWRVASGMLVAVRPYTPVDTGRLVSSHSLTGRGLEWTLYNDTPYAASVHKRVPYYDIAIANDLPRIEAEAAREYYERQQRNL
jgi:hypothetical protein